ncbi:chorismate-binding protein [Corallincola holothuriorum]|uniref:Chorismate-binding protein n=1 Tax=Corallincola holothuriorum TaxID=2282215 RepID=A0A368NRB8_9GAMM|nr:chromate efflux transporter [Corallincola holothuriorum]RCU52463.1 chorismate-binding protein [Corallincola holothuriorum]
MLHIFRHFFLLGLTSFGGPAAHLGYFHRLFVVKLGWLDEAAYARLVALSQFLPGPGSSQVGFAIGLKRGGLIGGLIAFTAFTLPSFLVLLILAVLAAQFEQNSYLLAAIHGLKLLAVIVVADATMKMFNSFCKCKVTAGLCVFTSVVLLLMPGLWAQCGVLVIAATIGAIALRQSDVDTSAAASRTVAVPPRWWALLLFAALFLILPLLSQDHLWLALFSDFFQAGSLVFGGGHVVLPLLQVTVGDSLSQSQFLTGYAAAQAVPGPMFTLATYLGAMVIPSAPVVGAIVATLGVFMPGLLLMLALHNSWEAMARRPLLAGVIAGINAAVVGLLLAALYQPVFSSAVGSAVDFAWVVVGFFLLNKVKMPVFALVVLSAGVGLALSLVG